MEELFALIEAANLKASDVVRMTHGEVSLNLASQWLNCRSNDRKLSRVTKALLKCLCEKVLNNGTLAKQVFSADQLYLKTIPKPKKLSAIYFLFKGLDIVYVGQTKNLFWRIIAHINQKTKDFDRYSFIVCEEKDLEALEMLYISKFRPKYNAIETDKHFASPLALPTYE